MIVLTFQTFALEGSVRLFCALAGKAFGLSGFPNIVCSTIDISQLKILLGLLVLFVGNKFYCDSAGPCYCPQTKLRRKDSVGLRIRGYGRSEFYSHWG